MRRAAEAGRGDPAGHARLLPRSPKSIQDLIDFVVARICDQLGIANDLIERWES